MYELTPLNILRAGFDDMHKLLDQASDLSADQLNFQPGEGVTPFFSLWHYVRTEDNIVNFVIEKKGTTIWLDSEYDAKFGLPRVSQGTGMTAAEAADVRISDVALWHEYQQRVWQSTSEFLDSLSDADLQDRQVFMRQQGDRRLWEPLNITCLAHGYRHVGEIEYARGVVGLGNATGQ